MLQNLIADPPFRRAEVMVGTSQCAAVSLYTLWIATWLCDVAGFDQAAVGRTLMVVSLALIAGSLFFGRTADWLARRRMSELPLVAGGAGLSSVCLLALALGAIEGALWLRATFIFASSGATLPYSIMSRRYPKEMTGRVSTTLNTFIFTGMFLCQWVVGLVLERWPPARHAIRAAGLRLGARRPLADPAWRFGPVLEQSLTTRLNCETAIPFSTAGAGLVRGLAPSAAARQGAGQPQRLEMQIHTMHLIHDTNA